MINILIVTHGPLAKALEETSKLIVGDQSEISTIGLFHGDNPEDFKEKVGQEIELLSKDTDLIIFTDLYGGTPSNSVLIKLNELKFPDTITCYTGVNLPLLLEAIPLLNTASNVQEISNHLDQIMYETVQNISQKFSAK